MYTIQIPAAFYERLIAFYERLITVMITLLITAAQKKSVLPTVLISNFKK